MKAIILAGGLGTRLRPITYEIPKPLIPIKKKTLLNYQVEFLLNNRVRDICIITEKEYYQDFKSWSKIHRNLFLSGKIKIFFQPKSMGTFGAIAYVKKWLGKESFIVNNSDELKEFELQDAIKFHNSNQFYGTLTLIKSKDAQDYSVPVLKNNRIIKITEKPENPHSSYIHSGLCILSPKVFEYLKPDKENSLHLDLFPKLVKAKKLAGFKISKSRWHDCGTLALWQKAIHTW